MSSVRSDLTRQQIDAELREVDGVARWTELIYAGEASCRLDGRHLAAVLRARPGYLARRPRLRLVLAGVRTVTPSAERRLKVVA